MFEFSNCDVVEFSNCDVVEFSNCDVVECSSSMMFKSVREKKKNTHQRLKSTPI